MSAPKLKTYEVVTLETVALERRFTVTAANEDEAWDKAVSTYHEVPPKHSDQLWVEHLVTPCD